MTEILQTPVAALTAYDQFAADGRLIRNDWSLEKEGRHLACALGVIGIDDASACPSTIMPAWLAHMVPSIFDGLETDAEAFAWGHEFYAQLARLNGRVPDRVRDLLMCDYVLPIAREAVTGEWMAKIHPIIDRVIALLRRKATGEDASQELAAAADAAAAARYAAAAAADAAAAAARYAAAAAAAAAADARYASDAARFRARKRIADGLITLMAAEAV